MKKKMVEVGMVREVMHDLDITRFMTEVGSIANRHLDSGGASVDPVEPVVEISGATQKYTTSTISADGAAKEYLSPAEAVEHMRDVARLLHNWRSGSGRPNRNSA
jgi:hypothetical protein